jgi:hypothetical protein
MLREILESDSWKFTSYDTTYDSEGTIQTKHNGFSIVIGIAHNDGYFAEISGTKDEMKNLIGSNKDWEIVGNSGGTVDYHTRNSSLDKVISSVKSLFQFKVDPSAVKKLKNL